MKKFLVLVTAVVIILFAVYVIPGKPTLSEEQQFLADLMEKACTRSSDMKGSYILATDDAVIYTCGMNAADVKRKSVDEFTTYEIGSLTKMFTATAVLQLCEKGLLSLEDTLSMYFPEYAYGKDITLYQLLHMQSGLRRDFVTDAVFLDDAGNRDVEEFRRYFYDGFSDEELLSMLFADEPAYPSGKVFSYSNAGYTLLAMIIEKVTGQSFADYVKKNIFDVCGMRHSSSMTTDDVTCIPEYVPAEGSSENPYEYVDTLYTQLKNTTRGASDIHSCAWDMLLFDRALMNGTLLGKESLAEMFNLDKGYGGGWIQFSRYPDCWYHGGESYCCMAYNLYCRSEKYGNVYLIQLHPTIAGDVLSNNLMREVAAAVR